MNATLRVSVLGLAIAIGCAPSTTVEQGWVAHRQSTAALHRVVTIVGLRDGALRRSMEDQLAQRLQQRGISASPAYTVLTEDERAMRKGAVAKLTSRGYDGAIVMRIVRDPSIAAPESFGAFLELEQSEISTLSTVVRMESSAYSLRDNNLVWSVMTRTVDPSDLPHLIEGVTRVVAGELDRLGVVERSQLARR